MVFSSIGAEQIILVLVQSKQHLLNLYSLKEDSFQTIPVVEGEEKVKRRLKKQKEGHLVLSFIRIQPATPMENQFNNLNLSSTKQHN